MNVIRQERYNTIRIFRTVYGKQPKTMVHEYGHVIHSLYGYVDPPNNILTEEKPKLASEYRAYAAKNNNEFVACAWTYWYIVGDDYFSQEYPETYKFLQDMILNIK